MATMMPTESPRVSVVARPMTRLDVDSVVMTHRSAMPDFFLSSMGTSFLKTYYASLIYDPTAIARVAIDSSGDVVGFAVGSTNPSGFYRRLLTRRWLAFAAAAVPGLLRNPGATWRIVRAIRYPSTQPHGDNLGGLYSIGVRSDTQGRGVGRTLVNAFLEEARARGSSAVYLHADAAGNDGWNALLQKMGWRLESTFSTPEGRRMNEYWFVLEGESNVAR